MLSINKSSEKIGDIVEFDYFPQLKVLSIFGFTDSTIGETLNCFFYKTFKYSLDGVNFSDYIELTNTNLQQIPFDIKSVLVLRFYYERQGNDSSGILTLESFTLVNTVVIEDNKFYFRNSLFSKFFDFNSPEVLSWAINVLQKLYEPGIVPEYIERGINKNKNEEDKDYIDYWFSITHFFALFVIYARIFRDIEKYYIVLKEYLSQKNIYFHKDATLQDLQLLMKNFYNEISRRGNYRMYLKNEFVDDQSDNIHGEILRMICYEYGDEFIFSLIPRHKTGWNIGNSSPLHKGIKDAEGILKGYELNNNKSLLNQYPIPQGSGITEIIDEGRRVLNIPSNDETLSIGYYTPDFITDKFLLSYNKNLDYIIDFYFKSDDLDTNLEISLKFYNENGNALGNVTKTTTLPNVIISSFNHNNITSIVRDDIYYHIKCIIYNINESSPATKLNIGSGNNLQLLPNKDPKYFIPLIKCIGNIYGLKIKPLRTTYSLGFIQTQHIMQCWIKNNSKYEEIQIRNILRDLFTPYNSWLIVNFLHSEDYNLPYKNYWIEGSSVCEVVDIIWVGEEETAYCEQTQEIDGVNTGKKVYTLIKEAYYSNGILHFTGESKSNDDTEPEYIPPVLDLTTCPLVRATQWIGDESTAYCEDL